MKVQFNTVSLSINTATDFSLSKTTGGYRLRLKTPRGKTAYWLFVNDGSETDERDPFMFKGQNSILPSTDRKWLIRSPYLESKFGSGVITIRDGDRIRVLDFN
ncbi:MAG TPA: hypothetical protein VEW28_04820 [Candidatus Kapabacteria bacterium]|nr:hypothetical protein [Candidatus Kapabacteria bacterium]